MAAKKAKTKAATSPASLRSPRWAVWTTKPNGVTLPQAALLTMGLTPMVGMASLLRTKPKRNAEYRKRLQAFEAAYGRNDLLPRGKTLPKTVTVRRALEFACESEWLVPKSALNELGRLRHLGLIHASSSDDSADAAPHHIAAATVELTAPPPPKAADVKVQGETHVAAESSSRIDAQLQKTLGALVVHVHQIALERKAKKYLRGDKLNIAALARTLVELISQEEGANVPVTGFGERAVQSHISNAMNLFKRSGPPVADDIEVLEAKADE